MDTETKVTKTIRGRDLVGIAIATETDEFYIPVGHEGSLFSENFEGDLPVDLFADKRVIMHNAKFDLQILQDFEFDYDHLEDTMLMSHYIDENPPHGLKELAKIHLGYNEPKQALNAIKSLSKLGGGYECVPVPAMAKYAMQDARMTYDLYYRLLPLFESIYQKLWYDYDREFMYLLLQMETRGLRLDTESCAQQSSDAGKRLRQLHLELGFDPNKPSELANKLFSPAPYGLGLTPGTYGTSGRPTMDEAYLETVNHPVAGLVLEYRGLAKAKSTYFDSYLELSGDSGRIHPTFKQHGTLTGRLSCENPNLQNIPRDSPIKKLFIPEPNCELWEFDYRNIEMRLAAVYSQENDLLSAFKAESDFHGMVAKELGIARYAAKVVSFLIIYGGGSGKLAEQLNIKRDQAQLIIDSYRERFPGIFKAMGQAEEAADFNGYIKMWTGRRRHFKYQSEHHKAFNSAIQGGAFEIVKRGMLNVARAGYDMRNQVHDSIWVNIPKDDVKTALEKIPHLMSDWTTDVFELTFTVDSKRLN